MNDLPFPVRLICALPVVWCAALTAAEPVSITCSPTEVILPRSGDVYQLLVDLHQSDDGLRDVTSAVAYESLTPSVATVSETGVVTAHGAGLATLRVSLLWQTIARF